MSSLLCLVHLILNMKKILSRYSNLLVILSHVSVYFCRILTPFLYYIQGTVVPKKTVRTSESTSSVSAGGSDGLPREDISGKFTPTLVKSLESPDWKVWLLTCTKLA